MTGYAIVAVFTILYFSLSAYFISKENEVPSFVRCFFILVGSTILSFVITCVMSLLLPAERFESDQPYTEQSVSTSTEQMDTSQNQMLDSDCDYIITANFNMEYNNHVGSDWLCSAKVGKSGIAPGGTQITVYEGQEVDLSARCVENDDGAPDVGESSCYIVIEKGDIGQSFSVTDEVIVTENGGRYKGNTAKFTVTYYFDPV